MWIYVCSIKKEEWKNTQRNLDNVKSKYKHSQNSQKTKRKNKQVQSLLWTSRIAKCPPVQFLLLAFWHSDLTLADSRNSVSICQANRYFLFFLVYPVLLQLMGLDIYMGLVGAIVRLKLPLPPCLTSSSNCCHRHCQRCCCFSCVVVVVLCH